MEPTMDKEDARTRTLYATGFWSSVFLAVLTFITFAVAVTALPKSGPSCTGDCLEYPFLDSLAYYPGDYYWMFLAMFQITVWVVWMLALHFTAPKEKKIFGFAGVGFSLVAAMVLYVDYYLQLAVVPVSLMKGETDGIALLTQYNDHGIFIALEELGYLLMSLSLFCMALTFSRKMGLQRNLKRLLTAPFILTVVSLVAFLIQFGLDRSYRFEIAAISLNWLVLIIAGIMTAVYFQRLLKQFAILAVVSLIVSCSAPADPEALKKEVFAAEKAFETMAAEKGIAEAFAWFAAEDAVIKRGNDSIISGKEGILNYYTRAHLTRATVNWTPDHISVSADGTLAWTYGKYEWKVILSEGDTAVSRGIFHTVWKRQADGSWKYVWD